MGVFDSSNEAFDALITTQKKPSSLRGPNSFKN